MTATTASPQPSRFKRWALALCLVAFLSAAAPSRSFADEPEVPDHDARLDGYPATVVLNSGGTASSYIVLSLLGVLCIGSMFIKGKRTHLD
jgi:hypothetical protein